MTRDISLQEQWTQESNVKKDKLNNHKKVQMLAKTKRKSRSNNLSTARVFMLSLLIIFLSLVLLRETKISTMNREISTLKADIVELTEEKDSLARALQPYTKKDKIEKLAMSALGMDYPTKAQKNYVQIEYSPKNIEEKSLTFAEKAVGFIFGLFRY